MSKRRRSPSDFDQDTASKYLAVNPDIFDVLPDELTVRIQLALRVRAFMYFRVNRRFRGLANDRRTLHTIILGDLFPNIPRENVGAVKEQLEKYVRDAPRMLFYYITYYLNIIADVNPFGKIRIDSPIFIPFVYITASPDHDHDKIMSGSLYPINHWMKQTEFAYDSKSITEDFVTEYLTSRSREQLNKAVRKFQRVQFSENYAVIFPIKEEEDVVIRSISKDYSQTEFYQFDFETLPKACHVHVAVFLINYQRLKQPKPVRRDELIVLTEQMIECPLDRIRRGKWTDFTSPSGSNIRVQWDERHQSIVLFADIGMKTSSIFHDDLFFNYQSRLRYYGDDPMQFQSVVEQCKEKYEQAVEARDQSSHISVRLDKTISSSGQCIHTFGNNYACIVDAKTQKPICDHIFDADMLREWLQESHELDQSICPLC